MRKRLLTYIYAGAILLTSCSVISDFGSLVMSQTQQAQEVPSMFDKAIAIIKKYEGLHSARHWPLVGYGHKVLPTDNFKRGKALTEAQADELLRKDLANLCKMYASFGPDSLILATLAYNLGHGAVNRSTVYKKLKAGERDIKDSYLSHCRYRGKVLSQLQKRRIEEFETLFVETPATRIPERFELEMARTAADRPVQSND